MPEHPLHEKALPDIRSKHPLVRLEAICSYPISYQLQEQKVKSKKIMPIVKWIRAYSLPRYVHSLVRAFCLFVCLFDFVLSFCPKTDKRKFHLSYYLVLSTPYVYCNHECVKENLLTWQCPIFKSFPSLGNKVCLACAHLLSQKFFNPLLHMYNFSNSPRG